MKSVLILGGARGIGKAVVDAFFSDGFGVTVVARTQNDIDATVEEFSDRGEMLGFHADISLPDEVQRAVHAHLSRFECIDVVVNTAGIQGPIGLLWENDPVQWARNISINLVGSFNVAKSVVPEMIRAGNGVVVLFSGGGAAYARPRFSAYGVGKTGVLRLVETVHEELMECEARGVRIYAVAPGAVRTRMTEEVLSDMDSAGEKAFTEALTTSEKGGTPPERASELCLFLAKERPVCLSGRLIHVNEPYREYVASFEGKGMGDRGMLRRVGYE